MKIILSKNTPEHLHRHTGAMTNITFMAEYLQDLYNSRNLMFKLMVDKDLHRA